MLFYSMMHCYHLVLLIVPISCLKLLKEDDVQNLDLQVQVPPYGTIQGQIRFSVANNARYFSFEGIPYAKPPLGDLRFKAPQEPESWNGVLLADGSTPMCIEIPHIGPPTIEEEDCLYLSVYKPYTSNLTEFAVMVWFYGGGFSNGKNMRELYGPDYLITQNVIIVTLNYRLNAFGFLSTGDLASPGNYGIKDQLMALKWVKRNIKQFGGDSNNIVIFGESAGAASVQYQILNRKANGLFHGAISESGSVLCNWAFHTEPYLIAKAIAQVAGFKGGTNEELVAYLRKLSAKQLKRAAYIVTVKDQVNFYKRLTFGPVLEAEHEDAFITKDLYKELKAGRFNRVPYLVGFNSQEAATAQQFIQPFDLLLSLVPKGELMVPKGLTLNGTSRSALIGEIEGFYFGGGWGVQKSTSEQILNFVSDTFFYRPIIESARLYSIYAPIYMYRFAYEGYLLGRKALLLPEDNHLNGVQHAEELWYLFSRFDLGSASASDRLVRRRMVRMWTNFAKFRNPTPGADPLLEGVAWQPLDKGDREPPYLDIDVKLEMRRGFKKTTIEFWRGLFRNYGTIKYTF